MNVTSMDNQKNSVISSSDFLFIKSSYHFIFPSIALPLLLMHNNQIGFRIARYRTKYLIN
jgi:hypothetical protein